MAQGPWGGGPWQPQQGPGGPPAGPPGWGPPQGPPPQGPPGWGGHHAPGHQQPFGAPAPFGAPGPVPKSSSKGCIIGLLVGVLVLVASIGGIVFFVIQATAAPREAGHAFMNKIRKGKYDAAWEDTSKAFKKATPKENFQAAMDEHLPSVAKSKDATFDSTSITNDVACLSGSLDVDEGDRSIHVRLVKEGGEWRVEQIASRRVDGC